ncbi:stalk domain-containing protein [Brevibacillus sp. H7]|uniref:stalk domain-containing protein n=1 Tax=Brevibacillus sp. H7 TaxID=3349138 RepID=UPI00381C20AC
MKRRFLSLLASSLLGAMLAVSPAAAAGQVQSAVTVKLDGKLLSFTQAPQLENGRLLVPYRAIAEAIGAGVQYEAASKTVIVTKGDNTYRLPINAKTATLNGVPVALDTPARLVNNTTLVPLRFVSEYLGMTVSYDQATRTVSLQSASKPGFAVISLSQGAVLHGDKVTVGVAVFNHDLADFTTHKEKKDGQGHVHLWLDTDPTDPKVAYKLIKGEPVVFDNVKPGSHTLTVQLVGNDHKPVQPEVKQVIAFTTMDSHDAAVPAVTSYHVDIHNFAFAPGELTVEAGSKIIFTNKDDVVHTVTAVDGSFHSGALEKGKTYEMTFAKPGVYKIYCKPHTFMTGTITVK